LGGRVIRHRDEISAAKIIRTDQSSGHYEELRNLRNAARGVVTLAGVGFAVFSNTEEYTNELLFDMPSAQSGGVASTMPKETDQMVQFKPNPREVFVVHGRDIVMTTFFLDLLRRFGLQPLDFETLISRTGSTSPYIGEVVRSGFDHAKACVVLFTGDEEAQLRAALGTEAPGFLPRPNVMFEAGMAMALQRERTIIVEVPPLRTLSDLAGVHTVRFATGAPAERNNLRARLETAGCQMEKAGNAWLELPFPLKITAP
jgi:predicted nucleotide-binding protein